jgi:rhodanese-related sulfurtransferase
VGPRAIAVAERGFCVQPGTWCGVVPAGRCVGRTSGGASLPGVEPEVSLDQAAELAASGRARLVDVRRDEEWSAGHIAGAHHVPLDELSARAEEIGDEPVLFYCGSGDRARMAAEAFVASGREAASVAGGLRAWRDEGRPVET